MALESPVAAVRAMTQFEGRSSYLDADAGSLDSAGRRLALAEDERSSVPERVRVLADVGRFVDEFFQLTGSHEEPVRKRVQGLLVRQANTVQRLRHELGPIGVELCDWSQLNDDDRQAVTALFRERIVPVLGPLVIEAGKPLPPPANLSMNVAVIVGDAGGRRRFGTVELPPVVPRFVRVRPRPGTTGVQLVPFEQVVMANLALLFPAEEIQACAVFRVTRQAGVVAAPGVDDMLTSVERQLRLGRHGPAVRLEVDTSVAGEILERLMADLGVDRNAVYAVEGLMGVTDLGLLPLPDGGEPAARFRGPVQPASDVFARLDNGEMLVHFPYESYNDSVVALLDQASADPALLAIKQALYRPSPDGPTVRALVRAAERGAHVVAVVELAARLDERNSVASARALERAGAHVVYGLVGLRTHCPLTLVIRDAGRRVSRYGVVGTGLHHPTRRPEGMSLLSADPDITADLTDLFNYLTGYSRPARFRKLLVGPGLLRNRLLEMIRREAAAGPAGRIVLKVYRLVDREIIDAMYRAAQRGVRVDLVVSGACALRPGVAGLSEGVRVVATVGRHFETSRLFAFGSGESSSVFLSSGDLGLAQDRQVDVAAPVDDPVHRARLQATLDTLLQFPAWEMDADGTWHRHGPGAEDALRQLAASAGISRGGRVSLR
ncbi:MAG: polyphosphate kinase [Acidimicrobiia bacterium]